MSIPSMPVLDISRLLTPGHPNWPGDAPFTVTPGARIAAGDSVNTGVISTSTHTGTHVDAPWHYDDAAPRLHEIPLDVYVGPALVVRVPASGHITSALLEDLPADLPPRLLLCTGQPAHWDSFPREFTVPTPEFVQAAGVRGVRLLGLDVPSMDPLESRTLDSHHAAFAAGIHILESLSLSHVAPGQYTLVCLPLPLHGADGAPARAILLP
ncbi:cyclase family protein [Deinococcus sp. Marseille-Q6407]|uniref:cyclase family protein n=1 Tax=Deinococcus sp. Marseille-Q6407 TaxID=2969223 RepID=UPI0021C24107|nr:cyclase family protein [Deinococcus sp. Marseille-Q6407]